MAAGATRLAGVIGWPVAHSLSPALHQAAFDAAGFDAVSVALPVEAPALPQALASLAAMDALGVSVTMPHKHAVAALATSVDPLVQRLGAANCLTFTEGAIHATSTDGRGFLDALLDAPLFRPHLPRLAQRGQRHGLHAERQEREHELGHCVQVVVVFLAGRRALDKLA